VIVQRFAVPFEYPVHFTEEVLRPENRTLVEVIARCEPERRHRALVVVDEGLAASRPGLVEEIEAYFAAHADRLRLAGEVMRVPGGEAVKNDPAHVDRVRTRLYELHLDRQSFVVVFGGGAVQDMAGYAAATVHRGMRVVRLPSTVLAQNDAGLGVKNGISAFGTKNSLGTFAPPFAVIDDFALLSTLSRRDRIAGIAEAVKVALIRDAEFFAWLREKAGDLAALEEDATRWMVRRCAELHLRHIATGGDPFELGSTRPLDFGHWAAHRLEILSENRLRHGEAVAIGIALDSRYSVEAGLLSSGAFEEIFELLGTFGLPRYHELLAERDETGERRVFSGLDDFREHLGGELAVTLLARIGQGIEVHEIDRSAMERSIDWLAGR